MMNDCEVTTFLHCKISFTDKHFFCWELKE
jgi:hypothetical protein